MKRLTLLSLFLLAGNLLYAQVMFRNDFVFNRKTSRLQNKGLTYVTFNVGSRHTWNLNAYGQPSKSIRIDVAALLGRKRFTYQDVVESMYRPMAVYKQSYIPIPLFLLLEPPRKIKLAPYSYFSKRTFSASLVTARTDF